MSKPLRLADALGRPGAPSALGRRFSAALDEAAQGCAAATQRLRPRRRCVFAQEDDGAFAGEPADPAALRGALVEYRLDPARCVFREIELPARAAEFLTGVVRAQIDRLTPWRAEEVVFGCGAPSPRGPDRIAVTVAVVRRSALGARLESAADAVRVTVARPGEAPIALVAQEAGASARREGWRRVLQGALAGALLASLAALIADQTLGAGWRAEAEALAQENDAQRAALLRRERIGEDPAAQALDARKRSRPASVVVLEALSRALPDDAYLTELQIKGDRVEMAGLAVDAASLIKHLEQSPHFAAATFTAPTTRGADEREAFRIAAQAAPINRISP